jgi:hypothetical protein
MQQDLFCGHVTKNKFIENHTAAPAAQWCINSLTRFTFVCLAVFVLAVQVMVFASSLVRISDTSIAAPYISVASAPLPCPVPSLLPMYMCPPAGGILHGVIWNAGTRASPRFLECLCRIGCCALPCISAAARQQSGAAVFLIKAVPMLEETSGHARTFARKFCVSGKAVLLTFLGGPPGRSPSQSGESSDGSRNFDLKLPGS